MLLESRRLLERAARWLLRNRPRPLAERERERKLKAERSKRARALPRIQRDTAAEVIRLLNRAAKDIRSAPGRRRLRLPGLGAAAAPGPRSAPPSIPSGPGRERLSHKARPGHGEAGVDTVERPLDDAFELEAPGFRLSALLPQVDAELLAMQSFLTDKMADVSATLANRVNSELGLAGNTPRAPTPCWRRPDHPRVGGEHRESQHRFPNLLAVDIGVVRTAHRSHPRLGLVALGHESSSGPSQGIQPEGPVEQQRFDDMLRGLPCGIDEMRLVPVSAVHTRRCAEEATGTHLSDTDGDASVE